MLTYTHPDDRIVLLHYAHALKEEAVQAIVHRGFVTSAEEAEKLAIFYWRMVDECVKDEEQGSTVAQQHNLRQCCEYLLRAVGSHLIGAGYKNQWDAAS